MRRGQTRVTFAHGCRGFRGLPLAVDHYVGDHAGVAAPSKFPGGPLPGVRPGAFDGWAAAKGLPPFQRRTTSRPAGRNRSPNFGQNQKLIDSSGREYGVSSEAEMWMNTGVSPMGEINRGNSIQVRVPFDVPPGTMATELELHDSSVLRRCFSQARVNPDSLKAMLGELVQTTASLVHREPDRPPESPHWQAPKRFGSSSPGNRQAGRWLVASKPRRRANPVQP